MVHAVVRKSYKPIRQEDPMDNQMADVLNFEDFFQPGWNINSGKPSSIGGRLEERGIRS